MVHVITISEESPVAHQPGSLSFFPTKSGFLDGSSQTIGLKHPKKSRRMHSWLCDAIEEIDVSQVGIKIGLVGLTGEFWRGATGKHEAQQGRR